VTDRVRGRLLVLAGVSGAVMVLLAFAPWVEFKSIEDEDTAAFDAPRTSMDLRGTETSRFRDTEVIEIDTIQSKDGWCSCRADFGDGYFVILAGLIVVASAALAFATRRDTLFGALMAVAALGALALSGFNALADWQAIAFTDFRQTEPLDGHATPLLWGLVLVSAIAALCGAILWGVGIGMAGDDEEDEEDLEYEEEMPERLNAWA
jgi:hypothetical protein